MMNKAEIHKQICDNLNTIYKAKNADYGDSFAVLRQQYPEAIIIRLSDKLNRLKTLITKREQRVQDESIEDTLMDLANYAIMEIMESKYDKLCKPSMGSEPTEFSKQVPVSEELSKAHGMDLITYHYCPNRGAKMDRKVGEQE